MTAEGGEVIVGGGGSSASPIIAGIVGIPNSLAEIVAICNGTARDHQRNRPVSLAHRHPCTVDWEQVQQLNRHGLVVDLAVVLECRRHRATSADENGRFAAIGILIAGLGILEMMLLAKAGLRRRPPRRRP